MTVATDYSLHCYRGCGRVAQVRVSIPGGGEVRYCARCYMADRMRLDPLMSMSSYRRKVAEATCKSR